MCLFFVYINKVKIKKSRKMVKVPVSYDWDTGRPPIVPIVIISTSWILGLYEGEPFFAYLVGITTMSGNRGVESAPDNLYG